MFSVLFKLKWFFREYRYRYLVAVTLLIMAGLIEMIPPKMIGSAIDTIREGNMTPPDLYRFLGQFFALIVLIYAVTYYWMYRLFGGAFLVERLLRSRLMRHFLKMAPPFYEKNRTGDLMARATNDLKAVSQTAGFGILTLIDSTVFMLIIIFTMGFMISWKLTFTAMLPLPFIVLAMRLYGKTIHRRFTEAQSAFGVMNDHVLESVSGLRVLRAYVQEKADLGRFRAMTGEVLDKNVAVARVEALFQPTIKILIGTSYLIGLGYGAWFVFHNRITLGELVSFNVYLGMLIWPMFALGELINIMQRGDASLDRVNATLSHPPDVKDKPSPVAVGVPETIRFERVTFCYPTASGPSAGGNLLCDPTRPDARDRRSDGKRKNDLA